MESGKRYRICGSFMLLAAFLAAAAFFFSQKVLIIRAGAREKAGISFFQVVWDEGKRLKTGGGSFSESDFRLILGMLVLTAAFVMMILFSFSDGFLTSDSLSRRLFPKHQVLWRILPVLLLLGSVFLMGKSAAFLQQEKSLEEVYEGWQSLIRSMETAGSESGRCFFLPGMGRISLILAVAFYLFGVGYAFVLDTLKDEKSR